MGTSETTMMVNNNFIRIIMWIIENNRVVRLFIDCDNRRLLKTIDSIRLSNFVIQCSSPSSHKCIELIERRNSHLLNEIRKVHL